MPYKPSAVHEDESHLGEVLGGEYSDAFAQHRKYLFLAFAGSLYSMVHLFAIWVHYRKRERDQCGPRACGWKLGKGYVVCLWIVVFLTTCVVLGIMSSGTATCSYGILWEYHAAFWSVLMLGKILELLIYGNVDREMGLFKLLMKLNLGTLAAVDTYTDVIFVVVAHSCGEHRWIWVVSAVALVVGVGCGQYCILGIEQTDGSRRRTGGLGLLCRLGHLDVLAELLFDGRQYRRAVGADDGGDEEEQESRGASAERAEDRPEWQASCVASLRCLCEDGVQAALQVAFLVLQGQANPVVLASVAAGLLSSCASLCYASYLYAAMASEGRPLGLRADEERGGA